MNDVPDFRGFQLRDAERAAELERVCNPDPWTLEALRAFAESPADFSGRLGRVAVFRGSDQIAGYVCAQTAGEEAEILIFGVDPEHRRRGVGRALMLELGVALKALGCRTVFLEVRRENRAALSLYLSAGFVETGVRKNYYADTGEDAKVLRWDLSG